MPDENGYPTKEELDVIRKWKYGDDMISLLEHLEKIWWSRGWGYLFDEDELGKEIKILFLSTGGWSGNEEIIEELHKTDFWLMYWYSSRRGGHYEFYIPLSAFKKEKEEAE